MSRILILVWPEASAYNATLPLARALARRGDDVRYAAPARWAAYLERQGFPPLPLDPTVRAPRNPRGRRAHGWSMAEAGRWLAGLQSTLERIGCGQLDLVLLQPTLWQYALSLRRLGIPYLLANACLASAWNVEVPPIFCGFLPLPGHPLANGVRCLASWAAMRHLGAFSHRYRGVLPPRRRGPVGLLREAGVAARHLVRSVLEPLYEPIYRHALRTARREGVPIRWGDYGHRLLGPELVLGPAALDSPWRRPRIQRVFAGACVDVERVEDALDESLLDTSRRLVYCSVGSHGLHWNKENHERLLRTVVEVFRTDPDHQVLLQTSTTEEAHGLEPLPHTILAAAWYPQLQVLARASVAITHGGFGTVREALFHGVPLIIFPRGVDQPGNAARVARLGAGLVGDIRSVTPASLRRMLRRVETPSYRERARRLGLALRADNTAGAALALIDRHVRDRGRHPAASP